MIPSDYDSSDSQYDEQHLRNNLADQGYSGDQIDVIMNGNPDGVRAVVSEGPSSPTCVAPASVSAPSDTTHGPASYGPPVAADNAYQTVISAAAWADPNAVQSIGYPYVKPESLASKAWTLPQIPAFALYEESGKLARKVNEVGGPVDYLLSGPLVVTQRIGMEADKFLDRRRGKSEYDDYGPDKALPPWILGGGWDTLFHGCHEGSRCDVNGCYVQHDCPIVR